MTSSTLPDISRDKLDRHDHMVDLLKARVEEQDATIQKQRAAVRALHDEAHEACDAIAAVTGIEQDSLPLAVENVVSLVGNLRHRIDEVQKQLDAIAAEAAPQFLGLTVGDLAEVLKEEAEGEDNAAVRKCLVLDDGDVSVVDTIRELCAQLRFLDDTVMNLAPAAAAKKRGAAQLAAIPPQKGPFVITMKLPQGRRFWGPSVQGEAGWVSDLAGAFQYAGRVLAESVKPRRSAVVSLDDARELIEAEKVVSITPPADAPTGPEAA